MKTNLYYLYILPLFFCFSCSKAPNTPEDLGETFASALKNGDYKEYLKLTPTEEDFLAIQNQNIGRPSKDQKELSAEDKEKLEELLWNEDDFKNSLPEMQFHDLEYFVIKDKNGGVGKINLQHEIEGAIFSPFQIDIAFVNERWVIYKINQGGSTLLEESPPLLEVLNATLNPYGGEAQKPIWMY